ncbi:MAG: glucosamine-6-phosphate isomerase, partial [Bacteroidetes bacterium]|nr:glucosamine-6-phosphate isomerase [Bacteroidota bacterium]
NWNNDKGKKLRDEYGLDAARKPELNNLKFVQIDEFYPINSQQHNSFHYYVNEYYIKGFGLDPKQALLINSDTIPLAKEKHFSEIFPDSIVDLSLRYREAKSKKEQEQQQSIFMIDDWCCQYEAQVRERGGIGFFLGGIGPDGHIAFNTRGSDHYSTTRLTATNFETQAVAAGDLGGIEISRHRLVITIGLETITYNKNGVAIIFAAGEAKAGIVKDALESKPSVLYPASVLQRLPNSRFYLTQGAASQLRDSVDNYYKNGPWTHDKTEKAIIDLCRKSNKYGHHLVMDDLKSDPYTRLIPNLNNDTVQSVMDSIKTKMAKGLAEEQDQVYYHTGPHHDDIMLGMLPPLTDLINNETNKSHFSVLTSGFTAVTNEFIYNSLVDIKQFIEEGQVK